MSMWPSILAQSENWFWLPKQASTVARDTDNLFNVILWICVFFFLLVTVLLIWFVIQYRHKPGVARDTSVGHSTFLEITWTAIPSIIVVFLYYYGFKEYMNLTVEPPNSYEITATGQMWTWKFTYPNGYTDPELHVPLGRPVRVVLQSNDVIHSLYLPAFRVKKDVVPGRFNRMWFQATEAGEFQIFCAAYCGTNHSIMYSKCIVQEPGQFDAWLAEATRRANNRTPLEQGRYLYNSQGCVQCHSIDGKPGTGPTWKDMFGSMVPLNDGTSVLADEAYVKESIQLPQAKIVKGFGPVMPPFTQLSESDIKALTAFMKSISVNYHGSLAELQGQTSTSQPATAPSTAPATQPVSGTTAPAAH